jgi:hypothetical protein
MDGPTHEGEVGSYGSSSDTGHLEGQKGAEANFFSSRLVFGWHTRKVFWT